MAAPTAYTGIVKQGKFIPDNRVAFTKEFLRKDGTRMVVTAKKFVQGRSNQANKYWWAVPIALFMDALGERDKEKVHTIVLLEIGHYDLKRVGKKDVKIVKDTHDLPADDFAVLIDAVGQLYAEWFGGFIPGPTSAQAQAMMGGS